MEVELKNLRLQVAQMITRGGEGHIPSSFSILDLVYGVYEYALRQSDNVYVDKFVLSKGHGAAALYAVLSHFNIIPKELLDQYGTSGSPLGGHPDRSKIPGVEANTGSLGHGMPFGTGLALGNKILKRDQRVFVLVGDGECQEGTIWEAANIASNNHLESLVVIVDWNGSAAQLQPIENLANKWSSFGWQVSHCDGNSLISISKCLGQLDFENNSPKVIVAKTTKGFGVSFLQGHGEWHHKIPNTEQMRQIELELS